MRFNKPNHVESYWLFYILKKKLESRVSYRFVDCSRGGSHQRNRVNQSLRAQKLSPRHGKSTMPPMKWQKCSNPSLRLLLYPILSLSKLRPLALSPMQTPGAKAHPHFASSSSRSSSSPPWLLWIISSTSKGLALNTSASIWIERTQRYNIAWNSQFHNRNCFFWSLEPSWITIYRQQAIEWEVAQRWRDLEFRSPKRKGMRNRS